MPKQETSRLNNLITTAANELTQKFENALDTTISQGLPDSIRYQWIKSAAGQLTTQYLNKPDQKINPEDDAVKQQLNSVIETLKSSNHPLSSFVRPKDKQQLIDILESKNLEAYQEAQVAAQQSRQIRQQKPVNSRTTAKTLLDQAPDIQKFGATQPDLENILKHLRNQPSVINSPTKNQLEQAVQNLPEHAKALNLTPTQAEQISQELLPQLDQIHHYVVSATDPLPQSTPFTPYSPTINPKTIRQARSLNVSPLALAYAKSGFSADDSLLSKDLQAEVSQIKTYLADPLNPQNKLSISGYLTATLLKPQVQLSETIYHPIYKKIEDLKTKTNQTFLKPFTTYKTIQDQYQILKNQKSLGWLIAPRMRARLTIDNLKVSSKRWLHFQMIKNQKRRRLYRKINKPLNSIKTFWSNWSPKGITSRVKSSVGGWIKSKLISGTAKLGQWFIKKGAVKLGSALAKTAISFAEAASGIGIVFLIFQTAFSLGLGFLKRLKEKIKKDKQTFDTAGLGAKAIQALITGVKLLFAAAFGTVWGLIGGLTSAIVTFLVVSSFATPIIGFLAAIPAFFIGGGFFGSLGALLGWNIPGIATAVGTAISGFFSSLSGASAATWAGSVAAVGIGVPVVSIAVINYQQQQTLNAAFFIPETERIKNGSSTQPHSCSQAIADRAKSIVDNLQPGFDMDLDNSDNVYNNWYNKSPDYPELFDDPLFKDNPLLLGVNVNKNFVNLFWCTWLIIKSFSESGFPIVVPHLLTHNLTGYFQGENRYLDVMIDNITIKDICPGMAVFFHIPAGSISNAHVAIVYSVSSEGFTTYESNAPYKTMSYPVDESGHFQIINTGNTTIEVAGFGTP